MATADIPWDELAFQSTEFTLRRYLEDKAAGREEHYFATSSGTPRRPSGTDSPAGRRRGKMPPPGARVTSCVRRSPAGYCREEIE